MPITRRTTTFLAATLGALLLAGCSGTEDPSKAGLGDGIRNLSTGTYDRRQRELRGDLKGARRDRERWRNRAEEMKAENRRLARHERRLEAKLAAVNNEIRASQARVQRAQRTGRANPARVRRINSELQALRRRAQRLQTANIPARRKADMLTSIQTEHDLLRRRTRNFTDLQ